MVKYIIIAVNVLLFSNVALIKAQNNTCANAQPFCTGTPVNYPASTNAGNAQPGPNYGCLGSQPNPAWFSLQVAAPGPIVIVMQANNDIDFIAWGPFPNLTGNCGNLTGANQVPNTGPWNNPTSNGCSFSGSSTETLVIQNALPGQNYILLITNFANTNQNINFNQTNGNAPGAGGTNCGILCNFTATATNTVCSTQTATFGVTTSSNIVSVVWNGPNGFTAQPGNTLITNITPAASGVYTAVATNTGTNPATNTCAITQTLTVIPTPTPSAFGSTVCTAANASLTVTGGSNSSTYNWTGPNLYTSNIASAMVTNAQAINSGIYTVSLTTSGCTGTASASIYVKPIPLITASSSGNYCFAQNFALFGSAVSTFTWSGPAGFSSNLQNPIITNNLLTYSGTYTLLGTANGCTASTTTSVIINPLPTIVGLTTGNVCQDQSVTLSATGGTAYSWVGSGGFITSNQPSLTFPNAPFSLNSVTFTIIGTDINGCVNTTTLIQTVYPLPTPVAYGSNACLGTNLILDVSSAQSYQWNGPNGFTSTQKSPIINNVNFGNAGNYTVLVTSATGCTATAETSCNVFPNPIVGFTGNTHVCKGESFSFLGNGALNYKWLATYGVLSLDNSFSVSSIAPEFQTTYTLVGADANDCVNSVVITPIVLPLPSAFVIPEKNGGCAPFCTTYNLNKVSNNIVGATWNFDNGTNFNDSTKIANCFNTSGKHFVTINLLDSKGCKSSISSTVQVYPIPKADFYYLPELPNENDNVVTFTDYSKNATVKSWHWDFFSNGIDTATKQTATYKFPEIGNYFVYLKVVSDHSCSDSIVKKLTVVEDPTFFIPNSFTPNSDGNNDFFIPRGIGVEKFQMDIFDRGGLLLYSTNDIEKGWDGKSKKGGDILVQGVYVYKITITLHNSKQKEYLGHLTLIR